MSEHKAPHPGIVLDVGNTELPPPTTKIIWECPVCKQRYMTKERPWGFRTNFFCRTTMCKIVDLTEETSHA